MGKENTCKAVPNYGLPNQIRVSCSKCGSIWTDDMKGKGSCPVCHKRIKKSRFSTEYARQN